MCPVERIGTEVNRTTKKWNGDNKSKRSREVRGETAGGTTTGSASNLRMWRRNQQSTTCPTKEACWGEGEAQEVASAGGQKSIFRRQETAGLMPEAGAWGLAGGEPARGSTPRKEGHGRQDSISET